MTERIIVTTRIVFFHIKSQPIALRMDLFRSTSGSPPSSVPAGQISLQKYGAPCPMMSTTNIGSRTTNTIRITYFSLRNNLSPRNVRIFFGNGILFSRSCISPKGQRNPHTSLPSRAPTKIRKPTTYYAILKFQLPITA